MKNVIYAQGGGATQVINASARGLIEACNGFPDHIGTVYAAIFGIEGVLREELLNVSRQKGKEIDLLSSTPASGVFGTCRYKLDSANKEDFERILDVFHAHNVGYFFYNGGNDSMDTAAKIAAFAKRRGQDIVVTGIPKTVDNDLGDNEDSFIDHTPGYGSTARFWAYTVREADQENAGARRFEPVLVLQTMGRTAGFISAAGRLGDPERQMPLLIFMPEAGLSLHEMTDLVGDMVRKRGRALVVAGEGVDSGNGENHLDGFGHIIYSAAKTSAAQVLVSCLNKSGLPARCVARYNIPGTGQRNQPIMASTVDIEEAYMHGENALRIALRDGGGYMSTILRESGELYRVRYDKVPLERVANSERGFPQHWLTPDKTDVTDDFYRYARPLIGDGYPAVPLAEGLERFSRFEEIFAVKKLPDYIPVKYRVSASIADGSRVRHLE